MTEKKQSAEPRTVTMYPDEWLMVMQVADTTGIRNLSAALRLIIREFARMQQQSEGEVCHDMVVVN